MDQDGLTEGPVTGAPGANRSDDAVRLARRLDLALEGTSTGTYEWDLATDTIRWSDNLGELWGRERGWSPADYGAYLETIHPDDREELTGRVRAAVETDAAYELDFRMLRPDGAVRWMHTRGHVVRDESGAPEALIGLVTDVQERRMAQEAAELLAAAGAALASSLDPEEPLRRIAAMAAGTLADWCAIRVAEPGGADRLVAFAHADTEREPVAGEPDRDAAIAAPMVAAGEVLGTIALGFDGPAPDDAEHRRGLAEELGRRAGVALSNAWLHRAQEEAAVRLRRLQAITDVALSQLPVDELLSALLVRVRDLLQGDFAVCLLLDPEEHVLVERAQIGLGPRRNLRIRPGEGIAGRIVLEDHVVIVPDVPAAKPASEKLAHAARSLMGAPLRVEGHTLGVLHVSTAQPREFTQDEEELLALAADRVARAVEQAAAYERARSIAVTLQRALLPESLPQVEGLTAAVRYVPGQAGSEIGGDWYDLVALRDGRTAVCVGDVGGRGVAAAAVMGRLRASLRAFLHVCTDAAEALTLLDDLVADDPAVFATVLLAIVDPRSGDVELSSAGHPPAAVAAGGRCRLLTIPVGVPIGAPAGARPTGHARLARGDGLVLYTDGLVERREAAIDERLATMCSTLAEGPSEPGALLDHLLARMLGGAGGRDDVAVVAVWRDAAA